MMRIVVVVRKQTFAIGDKNPPPPPPSTQQHHYMRGRKQIGTRASASYPWQGLVLVRSFFLPSVRV